VRCDCQYPPSKNDENLLVDLYLQYQPVNHAVASIHKQNRKISKANISQTLHCQQITPNLLQIYLWILQCKPKEYLYTSVSQYFLLNLFIMVYSGSHHIMILWYWMLAWYWVSLQLNVVDPFLWCVPHDSQFTKPVSTKVWNPMTDAMLQTISQLPFIIVMITTKNTESFKPWRKFANIVSQKNSFKWIRLKFCHQIWHTKSWGTEPLPTVGISPHRIDVTPIHALCGSVYRKSAINWFWL